jgi:hypothetical protein
MVFLILPRLQEIQFRLKRSQEFKAQSSQEFKAQSSQEFKAQSYKNLTKLFKEDLQILLRYIEDFK